MGLLETIYQSADPEFVRRVWHDLPYFSPSVPVLNRRYIKKVVGEYDRSFPSKILKHTLFPDIPEPYLTRSFAPAIDRGVSAFNELVEQFLGEYAALLLMEGRGRQGFRQFLQAGVKRALCPLRSIEDGVKAYNCSRSIGLGNLVGKVDSCPEVLRSLVHFDEVIRGLNALLEVPSAPTGSTHDGKWRTWKTGAGIVLFELERPDTLPLTLTGNLRFKEFHGNTSPPDLPIKYRLKYLKGNKPVYSSIIMKMLRKGVYPEEIEDYIGCEIIVENQHARNDLYNFIRNSTSFTGRVEGYHDTSRKNLNPSSTRGFRCVKFNLRFPVPLKVKGPRLKHFHQFERIPIEVQVYTITEVLLRDEKADHESYKRRQFIQLVPVLWPEEIYRPLAEARGMLI